MMLNISSSYNGTAINDVTLGDYVWFSKGVSVLLLRAGFVLVQIGCVPSNSVNKLVFQNLADLSISTVLYVCIGYVLAFGEDVAGVVGSPAWVPARDMHKVQAMLGWSTMVVCGAIFTAAVAGRISVLGQLVSSTALAGVVQPLALHWVRSDSGWLRGYRDQGGGASAHAAGGAAALVGASFLGRRLLLLRELDECSLPPSSPGNIFTGYMLVVVGLMAMSHPRGAVLSNMTAAGGAALTTAVLQKAMGSKRLDYWKVLTCFQGAVAGIVTVAPGLDLYHPALALALGICGAITCHTLTRLCSWCFLEDYMNVVPVHLVCGVLGTLFPPLYSSDPHADLGRDMCWQLLAALAIVGLSMAVMAPVFCIMSWCSILRDDTETRNHRRARRVANSSAPRFWLGRIFTPHRSLPQLRPGYRTKDAGIFLESVREEHAARAEVQSRQGAGEPYEVAQTSADTSCSSVQTTRQESNCISNRRGLTAEQDLLMDHRVHVSVFGREPEHLSTKVPQDSEVELVECGVPQTNPHKLSTGSRETILLNKKGISSPKAEETLGLLLDFDQWFLSAVIEPSLQDTDLGRETALESEDQEPQIEKESDTNTTYLTESKPQPKVEQDTRFTNCPAGDDIPDDTWEIVCARSHLAQQGSASEQNLSTLSLPRSTCSRQKSESYITDKQNLRIMSATTKGQLEESAGDHSKLKTKSDISKHLALLNKMKHQINSLDIVP